MTTPEIHMLPDAAAVAEEAAKRFVAAAAEAVARDGRFSVALAGGNTPKSLYELLAGDAFRDQIDWSKVSIYFGDERTVPPDHPDSNYGMARAAMLSRVPIAEADIHRMRGEIDPEEAAIEYGRMLKSTFGETGGLDLVLLGMGDDGHTASLFPATEALNETKHRVVANRVEKLNTTRLTMTAPFINRARHVLILVTGTAKAARLEEVLQGTPDPHRLPIQLIHPEHGTLTWLLDVDAAGMTGQP